MNEAKFKKKMSMIKYIAMLKTLFIVFIRPQAKTFESNVYTER